MGKFKVFSKKTDVEKEKAVPPEVVTASVKKIFEKTEKEEAVPPGVVAASEKTTVTLGRPRLLTKDVDVHSAVGVMEGLLKKHPAPDHASLYDEFDAFSLVYGPDIPLFLSNAIHNGMKLSSAFENSMLLRTYSPATTKEMRESRYHFFFSLEKARSLEDGSVPFDLNTTTLLSFVDHEKIPERKAFLWLMFATGARPACIFFVPLDFWILGTAQLDVEWRLRKAASSRSDRHDAQYDYTWSSLPPAEVRNFLTSKKAEDWSFICNVKVIASTVNAWLKSGWTAMGEGGVCPTSSAFRDHMDRKLRGLNFDNAKIKALMDHTLKISTAHYQSSKNKKRARQ